jgi:hypothetical protein
MGDNECRVSLRSHSPPGRTRAEGEEISGALTLVARTRNTRSLRNGSAGPESLVAGARNTRFLRLVERRIPKLAA